MEENINIVKKLRISRGLNQNELAEALGISPSMLGMIEQDRRKPNDEVKRRICNYFNISMDYLMGMTSIQNPKEFIEKELYKIDLTKEEFENYIGKIIKTKTITVTNNEDIDIKEKNTMKLLYNIYINYLSHNPYTITEKDNLLMDNKEYDKLVNKMKAHTNKIDVAFLSLLSSLDIKNIIHDYKESISNIANMPTIEIPILGVVKAGYNYLAEENWIGTVDVEKKLAEGNELFALKVKRRFYVTYSCRK